MGLFDKFRKKVRKAAEEVDTESLSAEEGSEDAEQALSQHEEFSKLRTHVPAYKTQPGFDEEDDEWEDFDDDEELELPKNSEDEWDEWEEDESYTLPTRLTRKERKIIAKEAKKEARIPTFDNNSNNIHFFQRRQGLESCEFLHLPCASIKYF